MFWSVGSLTRHVFLMYASLAVVKREQMVGRAPERGAMEAILCTMFRCSRTWPRACGDAVTGGELTVR